jgi:hypothetical protein
VKRVLVQIADWIAARVGRRLIISVVLFVFAAVVLISAQKDQGVARDEVTYMHHGTRYAQWWTDLLTFKSGTLTEKQITAHFGGKAPTAGNREHPPLMKTLFGFSERIFHRRFGVNQITAYRLPTALMTAALLVLMFLFVSRIWGWQEGLIAALLMFYVPRHFFHSGLVAFDAPIVTMWFATLYAYYKALDSKWWCLWFGVIYGLTLATKHNAVIVPAFVLNHYAWVALWGARDKWEGWRRSPLWLVKAFWNKQPLIFPAMFLLGPLVLVAVWPWMWFDTLGHLREWMAFHLQHVHYNFEYLGHNWNAPPYPWHVPIVTTALTVPVVTLVAGIVGAVFLLRRAWWRETAEPEGAPALLLFLSAGSAMGPFILTTQPIFGAEKHWAPAMPTVCIYAGIGVMVAVRLAVRGLLQAGWLPGARKKLATTIASVALGGVVVLAAKVETDSAHPYALSHYNALAGGAPGGADLGMNRQFWGYAARGVLPWLNAHAPRSGVARVYSHDASPAWALYQRTGFLDRRLPDAGREAAGIARSKFAIVIHELHFNRHDYMIWKSYGTVQPVFVLRTDGVPIVSVYERR